MMTRKKVLEVGENVDPLQRGLRVKKAEVPTRAVPSKVGGAKLKKAGPGLTRRAAFGDITNAAKEKALGGKGIPIPIKPQGKVSTLTAGSRIARPLLKKAVEVKKPLGLASSQGLKSSQESTSSSSSEGSLVSSQESQIERNIADGVPEDRVEEEFSFIVEEDEETKEEKLPVLTIDIQNYTDVFNVGIYAQDIFDYYKRREKMFCIPAYLQKSGCRITANMRAILVDWLVEIQENFELNHETLYLAVKLCDMYLSRVRAEKELLQLIGAASVFIASKFDERCPPLIEDFTYVCDNAFNKDEFIDMEMEVLRTVDFDLGIPISYRFLRRYAKVAQLSMETLTLARYILEMSLMEHDFIVERDSMLAAAALYIAMKMRKEGAWEGDVVTASGYSLEHIKRLVVMLNAMLRAPPVQQLSTIRGKYSHIVFHEVAKIPPLPTEQLL